MKKNTNINRPKLSAQEIQKGKDFDKLYKNYMKASKPFYKKNWFIANTIVVVGALALIFVLNTPEGTETKAVDSIEEVTTTLLAENTTDADFIDPMFDNFNVPFSSYKVKAKKGGTIEHTTGSFIKVPKNAFVDANGKLVKGDVEIKYREFKDVAEIIASGIPMTYKMGDEEMHFESAGMIEIQAYQNGKPVFMNPKKKIDIEMTSDYEGDHYNLYNLDTANKEWVDIGKDKIEYRGEEALPEEENSKNIVAIEFDEEGSIDQEVADSKAKVADIKKEIKVIQADIKKIEKTAPSKPQKATNERFRFDIDFKKEEFPELMVYKGMEFEVGDENKTFTPDWFKKEWQDMQLTKGPEDNYILELTRFEKPKKNSEKEFEKVVRKLTVYPVFVGENYKVAMAKFNEKYGKYSKKLKARKADEKKKQEEYEKELARIQKMQEEYEARMEKARQKSAMQVEEWIDNAEADDNASVTSSQMYRLFSIEKFGIYNCDNPVTLPKGQTIYAKLKFEDKNVPFNRVFLVEKGRNAVFAYYPNTLRRFKFNPSKDNMIIGVSNKNELIVYTVEQFKSIPKSAKSADLEVDVRETNPQNLKELRKCISFI